MPLSFALTLAGAALAGPPAPDPLAQRSTEALLEAWEARFEDPGPGAPWGCVSDLAAALQSRWGALDEDTRARLSHLDPAPPAAPAPPPGGRDTCWGQQGDYRVVGEHFSVEWDEGVGDEDDALEFLEDLEFAWGVEFEERGWKPPYASEDFLIQARIISGGAGAYTTIKACEGYGQVAYIAAGEGSFSSGDWGASMAAHELLHTSQFAYGLASEFWWWEASATWFEEYAHPESNNWAQYIWGYSLYPHLSMSASSQTDQAIFGHMYGMAIWAFFLDEYAGGHDLVRATWEYAEEWAGSDAYEGYYTLGMDETLAALGYDFEALYRQFVVTNTVMVYAEQGAFLRPNPASEVEALPWGGDIDDEGPRPEPFGQSYIQIDADVLTDEAPDLEVSFYGDPERRWVVALVVEDFDQIDEVVELELVDGEGVGQLRQLTDDDYIWLVATPLDGEEGAGFRYAAVAADLPEEDTGAGEAKGCSTGQGGGGAGGLLAALALAAAFAARREGRGPQREG